MYNNTEYSDARKKLFIKIVFSPFLLTGALTNALIVYKMVKKHWNDLLPIYVHRINFFFGVFLVMFSGIFTTFAVGQEGFFCSLVLFIYLFALLNHIYDIFVLQFDRLVAISKPLYQHAEVTDTIAWKIVLGAKLFTLIILAITSTLEPSLVQYQPCHLCMYVHPAYVITHTVPILAALILTTIVSIYASVMIFKQNKVEPVTFRNKNKNILEYTQENIDGKMEGKDNSDIVQNGLQVCCEEKRRTQACIRENEEIENDGYNDVPTILLNREILVDSIHVIDSNNVEITPRTINDNEISKEIQRVNTERSNSAENFKFKALLISTLKMNLLSLILLVRGLPEVMSFYYMGCYQTPGGCDAYFRMMPGIKFINSYVSLIHPVIVLYMIDTIN